MASIVLALIVSYGFCSMLGIFFGPVHHSLPFLLLGIGVDDMFIIMQNFFNLSPAEKIKPLPEKIGLMMQHAGASITVTSLTDFVAFAIGSATVSDEFVKIHNTRLTFPFSDFALPAIVLFVRGCRNLGHLLFPIDFFRGVPDLGREADRTKAKRGRVLHKTREL